jgi:hypothetical protein
VSKFTKIIETYELQSSQTAYVLVYIKEACYERYLDNKIEFPSWILEMEQEQEMTKI